MISKYQKLRSSIYGQVVYVITILSVLFFVSFGLIFRSVNEDYMKSVIHQCGNRISFLVEGSLFHSMLKHDKTGLENTMNQIKSMPGIDEVHMYFYAADCALLPMKLTIANKARWPSKITDYWAAGLPIIATPVSDLEMIFEKNQVGILSETDSVKDYTNALHRVISLPDVQLRAMSAKARNYAKVELDWNVLAERLFHLYKKQV